MHNPDYYPVATTNTTAALGQHIITAETGSSNASFSYNQPITVQFSAKQVLPSEQKLSILISEKVAKKEFFYGIELAARSFGHKTVLDYQNFGSLLPLFTSLIWLGQDYWSVENINNVESISFAGKLQPHTIVLPHFTCYRANKTRLAQFLALNFSNVLALRGDQVAELQEFQHASDLVTEIRKLRGDTISIGVGGYPEGHPDSKSLEEDMQFLLQKVNAGADFIITQICFSSEALIKFIKSCRANGIKVPILIGVFIPENMRTLLRIIEITRVHMPAEEYDKYQDLSDSRQEFRDYAVQKAIEMITEVFDSNLDIYGVQFFSMNKFKNIQQVLEEIVTKKNFENIVKV